MALYKPVFGESGGGGIVHSSGTTLVVYAPDGTVIYQSNTPLRGSEGSKWTLPIQSIPPGATFSIDGGPAYTIEDPTMRNEYGSSGGAPTSVGGLGSIGFAGNPMGGMFGAFGGMPNPYMINFDPINYNPIDYRRIRPAPYDFVDPIEAARRYNEFNLGAEEQAYQTGKVRGQELTDLDTQATIDFAGQMSGLQQNLVAAENKFNQAQRLQAVDFAMPDLRPTLDAKRQRGETYASGRLLSSAEDRAYQVAAESASADGSFVRGFGDDSVFGRRTSDILTAQQRLGISQMGEGMLNDWISQGSSILIDTPLKSSISQRLPSVPGILPSQQAAQQQSNLTNLTTIPLQFGISSEINQEQFQTNLVQGTRQFNAGNRLATDQFNASNTLAKDQFNSTGGFQASLAQFQGLQSNYQLATQASNRAEDIQRQDAHNQAASQAADANISAQQDAGDAGSIGGIVGGVIGAGVGIVTGGLLSQPTGPIPGGQALNTIAGSSASQASQPLQVVSGSQGASTRTASLPQIASDQGSPQLPATTLSGAPTSYQGASIPVASSAMDSRAAASDISTGYQSAGRLISNIGQSGPSTPQMTALGRGLSSGASAAGSITGSFPSVATPEAKMQLVDQLHGAASSNAPNPESKETVDQIFAQVREHLDTGVGVKGQAAGIAGFVQNYDSYNGPEKIRAITNISFAGQDLLSNYGIKDLTSESLAQAPIPGTDGKMSIQDALSLANSGYNVSSLVNNWDDISEVHSTINDRGNVLSIAATARNLGLLDSETPESIQRRSLSLKQVGATPAGAWGIGAVAIPETSVKAVENLGMQVIGKTADGQSIAVPIPALASTGLTQGVIGSGLSNSPPSRLSISGNAGLNQARLGSAPSRLSISGNAGLNQERLNNPPQILSVTEGASRLYNNWDTNFMPKQHIPMGGSAPVANGLYRTGNTDPNLLGNIVTSIVQGYAVGSLISGAFGSTAAAATGAGVGGIGGTYAAGSILGAAGVGAAGAGAAGAGAAGLAAPNLIGASWAPAGAAGMGTLATAGIIGAGIVGAVVAGQLLSDAFGGGKHEDQKSRDNLRSNIQQLGLIDEDYGLQLANGQTYDIGIDGHGGEREWFDPSKRRPDQTDVDKLHAYDVDYTKDLDAVMNLSGNALSALIYGGIDDPQVRQMGGYFTNAAVSNANTAQLTEEGYSTTQQNMQAFFTKAGIETKADAYALSNQMFSEGRLSQVQLVQIQQGINLTFDKNGYQAANQLLEGVKLGRKGDGAKKEAAPSKEALPSPTSKSVAQKPVQDTALPDFKMPQIKDFRTVKTTTPVDPTLMTSTQETTPMEIQNG